MGRPQPGDAATVDVQTLRLWEEMRIEILHELQDGASADIPETLIDEIGELVVMLNAQRAETGSLTRLPLSA